MTSFDRRLTPVRSDLAAESLRGRVDAPRFVTGRLRRVVAPVVDLRPEPRPDCSIDSQLIRGELVTLYDEAEGYAWLQSSVDGYVGYASADALGDPDPAPTHRVAVARTLVFSGPDLRLPLAAVLTEGAAVHVTAIEQRRGLDYAHLPDGTAMVLKHLAPVDAPPAADFVTVAEAYRGTPYLWGGRTSLGIDCSGLVQTALAATGIRSPRDSDLQEAALGDPLPLDDLGALRRGDLVFWKGHVGIVSGPDRLLHANGHHMATVEEPLSAAVARIAAAGSPVTGLRRLA